MVASSGVVYETFDFFDDGTVERTTRRCSGSVVTVDLGRWEADGEDGVVVLPPDGDSDESGGAIVEQGEEPHNIRRTHQCGYVGSEWFEVSVGTGDPPPTYSLVRGQMCGQEVPGENTCLFEWCEEPPPCDLEDRPPANASGD